MPDLQPPATPEEEERLALARAQLAAAARALAAAGPLPEGVQIDFGFMDDAQYVEQIAENEAAVFVHGEFGYTEDEYLPFVRIDLGWMERAILEGRFEGGTYGFGNELGGVPVPMFFRLQGAVDGHDTPLFINVDTAPKGWTDRAIDEGFYVLFPERSDGESVYLLMPPMIRFDRPTVVPPKIGRNDPCPCGSGQKFKRCHGR